jgi:hypothetical protein
MGMLGTLATGMRRKPELRLAMLRVEVAHLWNVIYM